MDLNDDRLNPVAMITGAASNVGAACARALAAKATGGLVLVDSDEEGLGAVADALEAAPERVSTMAFDVADEARWAQAREFIADQYGRLDYAIVNAGIPSAADVTETSLEDWRAAMNAKLDGVFVTLRSVMSLMRSNFDGGAIVVIAAAAAIEAADAAHDANKAGLLQLMRAAAKECGRDRIRVNAVASGVETPKWPGMDVFQDLVRGAGSERAAFAKLAKLPAPLARYTGADDIVPLVLKLLGETASVTGATLVVDVDYRL